MILTGDKLTKALRTPVDYVRLLDPNGNFLNTLPASEAVNLMARGGYVVGGSAHRVKYLRQLPGTTAPRLFVVPADTRSFEIDSDFWAGRATLRFWRDQRAGVGRILDQAA